MTNADPPDKIDDRESPRDGNVHAPDSDSLDEQIRDGVHQHHHEHECDPEARKPMKRPLASQHNGADLVGYGCVCMAAANDFLAHFAPMAGFAFVSLAK